MILFERLGCVAYPSRREARPQLPLAGGAVQRSDLLKDLLAEDVVLGAELTVRREGERKTGWHTSALNFARSSLVVRLRVRAPALKKLTTSSG